MNGTLSNNIPISIIIKQIYSCILITYKFDRILKLKFFMIVSKNAECFELSIQFTLRHKLKERINLLNCLQHFATSVKRFAFECFACFI